MAKALLREIGIEVVGRALEIGGDPRIESRLLLSVRAEAGRDSVGDDLDDATERLAIGARRVGRVLPFLSLIHI